MWKTKKNFFTVFNPHFYQQVLHLKFNMNPQSYPYSRIPYFHGFRGLFTYSQPLRLILRICYSFIFLFNHFTQKGSYTHMKLICPKSELQKSVSIVMKAVPGKTTMPKLEQLQQRAAENINLHLMIWNSALKPVFRVWFSKKE